MKRVLVINPFGIGDAIFSLTVVEALKKELPSVSVGFLCNERTDELISMDSSIDTRHVFSRDRFRSLLGRNPFKFAGEFRALLAEVRRAEYDTALDFSLGREYSFFAMLCGVRQRVGFNYKGRGTFLTRRVPLAGYEKKHVVDIQLKILGELGFGQAQPSARLPLRVPASAMMEAELLLNSSGVAAGEALLAVAPGGGKTWGPNARYKQWNPERFAAAADELPDFKYVLIGDEEERPLLQSVAARLHPTPLIAAGLPLDVAAALLVKSRALLCNDGGLLHLANALGVKTVSIFGPVDPAVYGPYGKDTPHEVLTAGVPCQPCYARFHFPRCAYDRQCQTRLSEERVVNSLKKIA